MDNIQYISLDINNNKINQNIYTKQYDVGRQIVFTITENGEEKDLQGMYAIFKLKKPDGFFVLDDIEIDNNRVILTLTDQMTVLSGRLPYQLSFYDMTDLLVSTVTGIMECEKSVVTNEDLISANEINLLEELLEETARIHDIAAMEAIAQEVQEDRDAVESATSEILSDVSSAAQYASLSKSYAVGGEGIYHDGVIDTSDNSKYYYENTKSLYNRILQGAKITLLADGWDENNQQRVDIEGVTSDEDHQLIAVFPKSTSAEEYNACNVMSIHQGDGYLIFKCSELPTHDLVAYVVTEIVGNAGVNYFGTAVPSDDLGVNGNIYLQHNDDGIVRVYGKTNNHWTPFGGDTYSETNMFFDTTAADVSGGIMTVATTYAGGNFINTHSIIYQREPGEWRIDGKDVTYTAEQDCAVVYYVASKSEYRPLTIYLNAQKIILDGVETKDPMYKYGVQFLKGGQTIGISGYNTDWFNHTKKFYMRVYPTMSNTEGEPTNSDISSLNISNGIYSGSTTTVISTEVG